MTRAHRRRDRSTPEDPHETGLLGILNVMLLLVPALLLMAHVTAHTAIVVSTPLHGGDAPDDGVIRCGGPRLEVAITHEAFFTRGQSGGWERVAGDGLDQRALEAIVREWKHDFPHETVATISAEHDIPFATLVATLDTLRGRDCRLAGAMAGEEIPEECLLWQPIIRDRTPNRQIPEFRRSDAWPPAPSHRLDTGASTPRRRGH